MSNVWLTIPSARPKSEADPVLEKWRRAGYKIALWVDSESDVAAWGYKGDMLPGARVDFVRCDLGKPYPGYAVAVNRLIEMIRALDPTAEWFVAAGDDTEPDPNHSAEQIALECRGFFSRLHGICEPSTYGVMQPTGDRFAQGSIDRIAGSPWIGREFAERMYGGNGPYWPEYFHMHVDEEIFCVANRLGVYWARPDLIHFHRHFMRKDDSINSPAVHKPIPDHLREANSTKHWERSSAIFARRKALHFPGHEPIAAPGLSESDSRAVLLRS